FGLNRDPERIPMRWDLTKNNGFTTGIPWLPMQSVGTISVTTLQKETRSILHLYRELMALRKRTPALHSGDYTPLRSTNDIIAYERFTGNEKFLIALNLTHEPRRIAGICKGEVVMSTILDRKGWSIMPHHLLRPDEGIVVKAA
ncbi:MAG: Maltodextrin glucosidase, partial [Acidimicrobiales bacterium]|nr:Maltodextrin glucosidase [Acidimicrobiales bacterium]